MGQKFVSPEFQLLVALYGIHFALWIPLALRLSPAISLAKFAIIFAPIVTCYSLSAIWLGVSREIRRGDQTLSGVEGFLPGGHLCLLVFSLLSPLFALY